MNIFLKKTAKTIFSKIGFEIIRSQDLPQHLFQTSAYLRHNSRRLEHLASLKIPLSNMSVLELGAGIGDHSEYFMDRGCKITITEAREENILYLKKRFPNEDVRILDVENPFDIAVNPFDVVYCYGLLYHTNNPQSVLEYINRNTNKMLLLETCVSFGDKEEINQTNEMQFSPTQAFSGTGCRPTRIWLYNELKKFFEYVYIPTTQPCHDEFPLDWSAPDKHKSPFQRAIFIASRIKIENEMLSSTFLQNHSRQM